MVTSERGSQTLKSGCNGLGLAQGLGFRVWGFVLSCFELRANGLGLDAASTKNQKPQERSGARKYKLHQDP